MTARVSTPAVIPTSKRLTPPCPLCDSTKGRTLVGEKRAPAGTDKLHQTTARAQEWRCFGCGRRYLEESDRT